MALNKTEIKRCFEQALAFYDHQAKAQQHINRRLIKLLQSKRSDFTNILEIGCGTGHFSQLLQHHFRAKHWLFNDLCDVGTLLSTRLSFPYQFVQGDAEQLNFGGQFDLIASASSVQWFTEPQRFLIKIKSVLASNGLLLLSTFTPDNLAEIRQLTGIGLNYPSLENWLDWLEKDFRLLHIENELIELAFSSPLEVLKHLKESGVTAVNRQAWTKRQLRYFCEQYQQNYTINDSQVKLSYTPLYILAQAKG